MNRFRATVALISAYSLLLAAMLGAIVRVEALAYENIAFCITGTEQSGNGPATPAHSNHGLDCLSCCACAGRGQALVPDEIRLASISFAELNRPNLAAEVFPAREYGSATSRGPPPQA